MGFASAVFAVLSIVFFMRDRLDLAVTFLVAAVATGAMAFLT